jgi:hypothetical protein
MKFVLQFILPSLAWKILKIFVSELGVNSNLPILELHGGRLDTSSGRERRVGEKDLGSSPTGGVCLTVYFAWIRVIS